MILKSTPETAEWEVRLLNGCRNAGWTLEAESERRKAIWTQMNGLAPTPECARINDVTRINESVKMIRLCCILSVGLAKDPASWSMNDSCQIVYKRSLWMHSICYVGKAVISISILLSILCCSCTMLSIFSLMSLMCGITISWNGSTDIESRIVHKYVSDEFFEPS